MAGINNSKKIDKRTLIREQAEGSLESFIRLIHPQRVLGSVHLELLNWWTREEAKSHQLCLLPRDHGKSAMAAYWAAWMITRNPAIRILYVSSTANLAIKQLKFIKDILTSDVYRFYWPEMIHSEEGKREKWTETEISVDHPLRKQEIVRDPTVFTAGLTTSITGLHFDIAILDDVVVKENAYTEDGRDKVQQQYSLLASIESADAKEIVVGTRYHPKDLYNDLQSMTVDEYDEEGDLTGSTPLYEVYERQVEDRGDGSGQFLWPRQQRYDGKWFGFDQKILAKKRAQYLDKVQFKAQYYNNPNDSETGAIPRDHFQYYDTKFLNRVSGKWYYKNRRLNVFAAVDFAFSLKRRADYTSIVVIGVDSDLSYYVLDVDRFKANQISEYFQHILHLHQKWDFRKIRAEVTVAQQVIVNDIKQNYIRPHGLSLSIEEYRPTRNQGNKEERVEAILQPRYANKQIWHYQGGNCQILEDELVLTNPPHDDVKDSLASAIETSVAPSFHQRESGNVISFNSSTRFGGI
jgi:phage terminase large subunit-like protein